MNNRLSDRWRLTSLTALFFTASIVVVWQLATWQSMSDGVRVIVYCLPLIFPIRGLMRGDRYTYRWATLCVLPYFVVSLTEAFANPTGRGFALVLLGASLLWFFSLIAYLRVSAPINRSAA